MFWPKEVHQEDVWSFWKIIWRETKECKLTTGEEWSPWVRWIKYLIFGGSKEISINDLCKGIKNLQAQDIFIDLEVNCPDVLETGDVNIYRTRITKDDLEICDDW